MLSTPEEQAVFSFMQAASVEDCARMNAQQWRSWDSWIIDHPWMMQALHDGLMHEGFTPAQCEHAMSVWLTESFQGSGSVSPGLIDEHEGVTWWQVEILDRATGDPTMCYLDARHHPLAAALTLNVSRSSHECTDALARIERHLLVFHPDAPVLVATHQPQIDSDDYQWPDDLDPCVHLAIESFVSAAPSQRKGLMTSDTQASDRLGDDVMASDRTRNHKGPYYYTAILHPPAAPLVAMRSRLQLLNKTRHDPRSDAPKAGPRF